MMICRSGTIIATFLNWIFRFSGSSCRPAYVGFMVMKIPNSGFMSTVSPSVKINCFRFSFLQFSTTEICWAATERTWQRSDHPYDLQNICKDQIIRHVICKILPEGQSG